MSRTADADTDAVKAPSGRAILVLLCAAQLMLILDVSVVNIALPSMATSLGFSPGGLQWIISGYALTFGGLLIFGGRCGDLFGRLRMFCTGLVVFTLASALGGLAQTSWMLIAGRLIQGAGAALVAPAALSLLTSHFSEGAARNRALGAWGAASSAGGAVGILLGGPLTAISWRAVLLINLPIGLIAVLVAPKLLSESSDRSTPRLDLPGAALITGAIAALVYGLSEATSGFGSPSVVVALAAFVVLAAAFVVVEGRTRAALVPLRFFRMRTLMGADAISVLLFGIATGTTYFLTLYLQDVLGYSALLTGLAFLPNAAAVGVASTLTGRLVGRVKVGTLLGLGALVLALGGVLFARIGPSSSYAGVVLPGLLVNAVGLGIAFVAVSIAATSGVDEHEQGVASGLFNTAQQIGAAVGLAILVTVATAATTQPDSAANVVSGYRWAFLVTAGFGVLALLCAAAFVRTRPAADAPTTSASGRSDAAQQPVGSAAVPTSAGLSD